MAGSKGQTRPEVPLKHEDSAAHRRMLAVRVNAALPKDGSEAATQPIGLRSYAVADLPTASNWEAHIVYVSDETGGAVLAFSDGTDWRRVTDRAIVS